MPRYNHPPHHDSLRIPQVTNVFFPTHDCCGADISQDDLHAFFAAHFSDEAVSRFAVEFLEPGEESFEEDVEWEYYGGEDFAEGEDEDDDLGYYPDGVKRTLTDEQIAMFRHSELEALRREKEKGSSTRVPFDSSNPSAEAESLGALDVTGKDVDEAGAPDDQAPRKKKKGKTKKRKAEQQTNREPKPDLR